MCWGLGSATAYGRLRQSPCPIAHCLASFLNVKTPNLPQTGSDPSLLPTRILEIRNPKRDDATHSAQCAKQPACLGLNTERPVQSRLALGGKGQQKKFHWGLKPRKRAGSVDWQCGFFHKFTFPLGLGYKVSTKQPKMSKNGKI